MITLYGAVGAIGAQTMSAQTISAQQTMSAQEVQSDKFRETDRGYAMCGNATGHTYHCDWDGSALSFQVDVTWVWSSSDKRLKKNIEAINQDYIDAVGSVDLFQYNLNRQGYSDNKNGNRIKKQNCLQDTNRIRHKWRLLGWNLQALNKGKINSLTIRFTEHGRYFNP